MKFTCEAPFLSGDLVLNLNLDMTKNKFLLEKIYF